MVVVLKVEAEHNKIEDRFNVGSKPDKTSESGKKKRGDGDTNIELL